MKEFNLPFYHRNLFTSYVGALGQSPDDHCLVPPKNLPILPIPARLQVTNDFIEIDGWVLFLRPMTAPQLHWFHESLNRWAEEDSSTQNQRWLDGIMQAFYYGLNSEL